MFLLLGIGIVRPNNEVIVVALLKSLGASATSENNNGNASMADVK